MRPGPSRTAALIAACRLADLPIGDDGQEARHARAALAQCGPRGRLLAAIAGTRPGRIAADGLERSLLPGIRAHYRWRRALVARRIASAIACGARQIVEIGPGFDPALARLAATDATSSCIMIDHPATLRAARAALSQTGIAPPNLRFVEHDFASPREWTAALDPRLPTFVVAIGVAMYLPLRRIVAALAALRARVDAPIGLIGSVMACSDGRPGFARQSRWIDRWLAAVGEPLEWGADAERLPSCLARLGWAGAAIDARDDPCPGEHLVDARAVR